MYHQKSNLHFVGIGGVGMAGIAEVLLNLGYSVSGSDSKGSPLIEHLKSHGARVAIGHSQDNIPTDTAVVVVSSAIQEENAELIASRERGIPVIARAEMLAELMRMKYGIAIAGSHGKTTTTTMTARILSEAGFDPTVIIGGRVRQERSGARLGLGKYLVAEADESDGSFSFLRPAIAVVTNIDAEHLSHYGSFGKLEEAFSSFMSKIPFYGLVAACGDDPVVRRLAAKLQRRTVLFGLAPDNDYTATEITECDGTSSYTLSYKGESLGRIVLPMPGRHMVSNSLAAVAVGLELGASLQTITKALAEFPGVARRSEVVGEERGVLVIDDYAHHPTEIRATLSALKRSYVIPRRERGKSRFVALFQPHRFTRTQELFSEFVQSFGDADEVIVSEIYPAGEEPIPGISGEKLAQSLQHERVQYVRDPNDAVSGLVKTLEAGDVVVTLGAGSIGQLGGVLVKALEVR